MRLRQLLLLSLVVGYSACGTSARAQGRLRRPEIPQEAIKESHRLFDLPSNDLPTALMESLLKKQAESLRLRKDQLMRPENQKKLEHEVKKLNQMMEILGKKDPRLASLAESMKGLDLSKPESWEKLMKQLPQDSLPPWKATGGARGTRAGIDGPKTMFKGRYGSASAGQTQRPDGQQAGPVAEGRGTGSVRKLPEPAPPGQPTEAGAAGSEKRESTDKPVSPWAQRLVEAASKFQSVNPSLRGSGALSRAIQNLGQSIGEGDPRWQQLAERTARLQSALERWKPDLNMEKFGFMKELSWPSGLPRPSLPRIHLPEPTPALNPLTVAPPRPGSSKWPVVFGLLGLVVVATLLWRLRAAREASGRQGEWRLGPWPVNPAAVTTREEVVRAFEYLSLLRLGRAARTWNHRTIARKLGKPSARGSASAGHSSAVSGAGNRGAEIDPGVLVLAEVYEQARYAPPADDLPPAALAAARTELCLLAGVSAS